jgi:hypothetical protein
MAAMPERGSSQGGSASRWRTLRRWLQPGLGVKRWLVAMVVGTVLFGLAVALLLLTLHNTSPQSALVSVLGWESARLLRTLRSARRRALPDLSFCLKLVNAVGAVPAHRKPVVEAVAEYRRLGHGPKVVAVGSDQPRPCCVA